MHLPRLLLLLMLVQRAGLRAERRLPGLLVSACVELWRPALGLLALRRRLRLAARAAIGPPLGVRLPRRKLNGLAAV